MLQEIRYINKVKGEISLGGDKSISHRALIFAAMADGESKIHNLSEGRDVNSTLKCLQQLGVKIDKRENSIIVNGVAYKGFTESSQALDCGNSGTTARLLSGLLIAQKFPTTLIGDDSLSLRPMNRVIQPLTQMGGNLNSNNDKLPINIIPAQQIEAINYNLPIPSAQIKSAILIAGLHSEKKTSVIESIATRDHTERMLDLNIISADDKIVSESSIKNYPKPKDYSIPGDISSASFFIVLALLAESGELIVEKSLLNKSRITFLNILISMGSDIQFLNRSIVNGEEIGDIIVKNSKLSNIEFDAAVIPSIIDEIPILTVAAAFSEGSFEIRGAKELRVKESDRIEAIVSNLQKVGIKCAEYDDGFAFDGFPIDCKPEFESFGDHRIAMAFSIMASLLWNGGTISEFECAEISNPDFINQLRKVTY